MKKLLALAALFMSSLVVAGPNDIVFQVRNSNDNGQGISVPVHPTSGPSLIIYNLSTLQPDYILPGTCLTISSGVLALTTACTPVNADWAASSGLSQILNKPSSFPPSSHTHSASDIVSGTLDPARIPALAIGNVTGLQAALDGKFATPTGTTAQYIRGDGSVAPLPAAGSGTVTSITAGTGLSGGTITGSGTISMPNVGTVGTYSGVTTDAQGRVTAGTVRSFNYTIRALNTCFQPSATRDVLATYSVDIATSLSLTTGQQGTVYLRTYTNSACSAGAQEVTRFVNGQTGTLTVGLALTQNVTGTLTGVIPAGAYVQLVTENNTGTPTFTARPGQETAL